MSFLNWPIRARRYSQKYIAKSHNTWILLFLDPFIKLTFLKGFHRLQRCRFKTLCRNISSTNISSFPMWNIFSWNISTASLCSRNISSSAFLLQKYPHQTFIHQWFTHQNFLNHTFPHPTFPHQTFSHQTFPHHTLKHFQLKHFLNKYFTNKHFLIINFFINISKWSISSPNFKRKRSIKFTPKMMVKNTNKKRFGRWPRLPTVFH